VNCVYFPTLTTAERSRASTLGLAAEAGIDISRNTYFSILRILTANQPTQFGLSYRVNEQVRVRASTDFSGESRGCS
jgi:translocation and assembly module TamB